MITIVDLEIGNLGSIENMLKKIDVPSVRTSRPQDIANANKLILPGVGSFDTGIKNLNKFKLRAILDKKVLEEKIPVLGVCLGMQLLTESSEEGVEPGLGWIAAHTVKFKMNSQDKELKIPHMGWNQVVPKTRTGLFANLPEEIKFYFVHSYYVSCKTSDTVLAKTEYGRVFTSAVQQDNIFGVQFHPEKSHKYGMQLLKNFSDL